MLKIKNTLSFAALIWGLLICFNAPASAQFKFIPPGSYLLSCEGVKTVGAHLDAVCSPGGGGRKTHDSLPNYFECDGDIANNHSKLQCNRNPNSPRLVKAKAALDVQYTAVTGTKIGDAHGFLGVIFEENGMARNFWNGNYEGLGAFLLTWLSRPYNAGRKAEALERAFKDVYNYGANPKDLAFYNAQNIGYTDVVKAETAKLNSNPSLRHVMINVAYKKTMGRMPTAGDRAYWVPRTQYFKQIVDANRAYLYSPNGANDLAQTVERALSSNMSGSPTSAQIKSAIVKYTPSKAIFDEM